MTSSALKWIALITMFIDHVGIVFFPGVEILRIIGRISFPLFAFLLANGFVHSRNKWVYAARLFVFAIIAEVPYDLVINGKYFDIYSQNVLFELFFALCTLIFIQKAMKKNPFWIFVAILFAICTELFYCSYGLYGVAIIVAFYLLRSFRGADVLAFIALTYLFFFVMNWTVSFNGYAYNILQVNSLQMYCLLSSVLIVFYNSKRGRYGYKWLFYIAYPAHLVLLYFLNNGTIPKLW